MEGSLEDRLAALERAVTDGEHDCSALADGAATADRVTEIEAELEDITDRVAEIEAATQALRGYVGNVRSVNSDVEERADLALSKAETVRREIDQLQTNGNEAEPWRCPHCERQSVGWQSESADPDRARHETPDSTADSSGLDGLREPTDARSEDLRAIGGTETDGGRREPATDRSGTSTGKNGEQESVGSVISRVRSLL